MSGMCEQRTAGIDVNRTLWIVALETSVWTGFILDRPCSKTQQESRGREIKGISRSRKGLLRPLPLSQTSPFEKGGFHESRALGRRRNPSAPLDGTFTAQSAPLGPAREPPDHQPNRESRGPSYYCVLDRYCIGTAPFPQPSAANWPELRQIPPSLEATLPLLARLRRDTRLRRPDYGRCRQQWGSWRDRKALDNLREA
jgi:hypothetical protein